METMRIKINMLDAVAQHKHSAKIAIFAGHRKFKIVFTHKAQLTTVIAFKTEFFQENSLIEKLYLHLLAMMLCCLDGYFFGTYSLNPIKDQGGYQSEPDYRVDIKDHGYYRQETKRNKGDGDTDSSNKPRAHREAAKRMHLV